ncbi:hypothetical protein ACP70R_047260 [Stipagrostis hirtigluma subsp. patula]
MARATASLFFSLLLLPHLGNSYHTSDTRVARRFVVRSSQNSRASTFDETCSTIPSGTDNGNKLPLFHRLSPCSPLNGAAKDDEGPSDDVFRRDAHRLRTILAAAQPSIADDASTAPNPAPGSGVTLPLTVTDRGILDYSVMVGYGTPAQPLPMAFDTLQFPSGVSTLRCKPCRSGVPCDQAFDPARSSTFARVRCGPECPSVCHDSTCSLIVGDMNGTLIANGTFVKDTLALSSSATFPSFTLACMDMDNISNDASSTGVLDLSPSRFSLVSRVTSSPTGNTTAAFSYCLPASTKSSGGFLSFGGALPDFSAGNGTGSTPLVNDTNHPMTYMIKFSGIRVDGTELPAPPQARLASLEVGLSITFLTPAIYTALRDEFRKQMAKYPLAAPYDVLDTCYNFTGISFDMPGILLQFEGGATLQPDVDQMMYFFDAAAAPHTYGCLAFAPTPDNFPFSVIGNMAQQTVEVVYDVRGGKVGFVQQSC